MVHRGRIIRTPIQDFLELLMARRNHVVEVVRAESKSGSLAEMVRLGDDETDPMLRVADWV